MKSSKAFDEVILYLETCIINGSEIDYNEISKITLSPASLFQRIFIFVSGVSMSDYVRKRRLTLAGYDLRNSDISALDAALKYGFQSHSAFTRAFKEHHGITPTEAKKSTAELNEYFSINFSDMRFIGGKRIMAEVKKIIYKEVPERLMVGLHQETSFQDGGKVWRDFFESDTIPKLNTLADSKCCDDIAANDGIGLMYNFKDMLHFNIIIGDFVKPDTEIPEGLFVKQIPKGLTVQIQIEGNNLGEILESAYLLITEAVEKTDREIDHAHFYWCEVYTHERYSKPLNQGKRVAIDYIVPIKPPSAQ
ncbi:helix-turn-helix domain-containing protein [Culicoidibacter larvae]|uniref:Helix-turn-helix domain-containing protein n=1 Tax=Culicoidibacter larvae TaxID=2579976 RepID=A0A5R8QC85_9FIRM|nr:helix-turn-helix domain-containing protein [Culicoidibacter larvae]TLG72938.1 helix-turn-helix domain-containing protein [Culicoidibacter larvae]